MPRYDRRPSPYAGRGPTIDLSGFASSVPAGTLTQPAGPVTADQAAAGMTRLPATVSYERPGVWQNLLTRGEAMNNYNAAVGGEAQRQAQLQATMARDAAERDFAREQSATNFLNQEAIVRLSHSLEMDKYNALDKSAQDKLDKEYEMVGSAFFRNQNPETKFTREQAIRQGQYLAAQENLSKNLDFLGKNLHPLAERLQAAGEGHVSTLRAPTVQENINNEALRQSKETFNSFGRTFDRESAPVPGYGYVLGANAPRFAGSMPVIPFQPGYETESFDPNTGMKTVVRHPGTPPSIGRSLGPIGNFAKPAAGQRPTVDFDQPAAQPAPAAAPAQPAAAYQPKVIPIPPYTSIPLPTGFTTPYTNPIITPIWPPQNPSPEEQLLRKLGLR